MYTLELTLDPRFTTMGDNLIPCIKLLRSIAGLTLKDAKRGLDRLVATGTDEVRLARKPSNDELDKLRHFGITYAVINLDEELKPVITNTMPEKLLNELQQAAKTAIDYGGYRIAKRIMLILEPLEGDRNA